MKSCNIGKNIEWDLIPDGQKVLTSVLVIKHFKKERQRPIERYSTAKMTEPVAYPSPDETQVTNDRADDILAIKIASLFIVPAIGYGGV